MNASHPAIGGFSPRSCCVCGAAFKPTMANAPATLIYCRPACAWENPRTTGSLERERAALEWAIEVKRRAETEPPPALESVPPGVLLREGNPAAWLAEVLAEMKRRWPGQFLFPHSVTVGVLVGRDGENWTAFNFDIGELSEMGSPAAFVDEIEARIRKNDEENPHGT